MVGELLAQWGCCVEHSVGGSARGVKELCSPGQAFNIFPTRGTWRSKMSSSRA